MSRPPAKALPHYRRPNISDRSAHRRRTSGHDQEAHLSQRDQAHAQPCEPFFVLARTLLTEHRNPAHPSSNAEPRVYVLPQGYYVAADVPVPHRTWAVSCPAMRLLCKWTLPVRHGSVLDFPTLRHAEL